MHWSYITYKTRNLANLGIGKNKNEEHVNNIVVWSQERKIEKPAIKEKSWCLCTTSLGQIYLKPNFCATMLVWPKNLKQLVTPPLEVDIKSAKY